MLYQFRQVDVFTETPYLGNPVAVVLGADGLSSEQLQRFARWTNLSETTFVLAPRATRRQGQFRGPWPLPRHGRFPGPHCATVPAWETGRGSPSWAA